jgi:hypothetical protein
VRASVVAAGGVVGPAAGIRHARAHGARGVVVDVVDLGAGDGVPASLRDA